MLGVNNNFSQDQKMAVDNKSWLTPRNNKETIHSMRNPNHINKIPHMLPEILLPN